MSSEKKTPRLLKVANAIFLAMLVAGCAGDTSDLQEYIAEVKQRPGGRIEPLPQIKPYESFRYRVDDMLFDLLSLGFCQVCFLVDLLELFAVKNCSVR